MRLHINIDHVATVRNARGTYYPDPLRAASVCMKAGANGITVHLREDRRHIIDSDVERIRNAIHSTLNLEMAATDEMVAIAKRVRPNIVTFVPERRQERTTEGGLDVVAGGKKLAKYVDELKASGIKVSLFIASSEAQIRASHALRVAQVELHTGEYCHMTSPAIGAPGSHAIIATPKLVEREVASIAEGARIAHDLGLEVAAGHGLTCDNVGAIAAIREISELNIGHAIVADAIFLSLTGAVQAMRRAIDNARCTVSSIREPNELGG